MQLNRNFYREHSRNVVNQGKGKLDEVRNEIQSRTEKSQTIITFTQTMMETFEQRPFCDVDALVFSWLSYIDFPEFCIPDEPVKFGNLYKAELFEKMFSSVVTIELEDTKVLFAAAAASPRYRDVGVSHYVSRLDSESLKQFSAVNFHVSDSLRFIAFRGTDKYIIGWKEDICLALADPVEAQKSSVRYLTRCAGDFEGEIITGGHSKGGNLAVYSAALCDESVRNKISRVYSFDGPGVDNEEGGQLISGIKDKIIKIVPQSSFIGLIMEKSTDYRIVKSDRRGFSQHMAYYWHIADGDFEYADELSYDSRIFGTSFNNWVLELNYEDRSQLVQSLLELFETSTIQTLDDINLYNAVMSLKKNLDEMSPDARKNLKDTMREIISSSIRNIPKMFEK